MFKTLDTTKWGRPQALFTGLVLIILSELCTNAWADVPPSAQITQNTSQDYHLDTDSGVMWRRCDLGTRFDHQTQQCSGHAVRATWADAVEVVGRSRCAEQV